ncbi:hypothetical protein HK18_06405 [Commensalibacter intestini]|uniref:Uncharacterized protein n=1 Tax=Commensalibacter intestini TaxID=479936 RepID=A0A251ZSH5_9PROT|nr:Imm42 family immunity protein [Commensalibacter intestini]OUI77616.1 hypothetical protein HK18_06405 [Commensalibacter intestini]
MIIGDPYQIAIQVEQIDILCSPSGMFNFIINDIFIPGKGVTIDLYMVISSLKESLEAGLKKIDGDIGDIPIEEIDLSEGEFKNLISLDNEGVLYDYGCDFLLGFDGNEERLIYTVDYAKSYAETRYPKGTVEKLIRKLPLAESLTIDKTNGVIITKIN